MASTSPGVDGASYVGARSFKLAFNAAGGASVNAAIDVGGYYLVAAGGDALVVVGQGTPTAAALPTSQPAAGSPNGHAYCPAGVPVPLDVTAASLKIAVLGATTSTGTLNIVGPCAHSTVRA